MLRIDIDFNLGERQWMAQRDEAMRAFGGHNAGEARGAQHVTFHRIAFKDEVECLLPHDDAPFGDRDALGCAFFGDVNHAGFAALIDMGEGRWYWSGLGRP